MTDERSPLFQARDLILSVLQYRKGLVLTDTVIRDAANNCAAALVSLLEPRGSVTVKGEFEAADAAARAVSGQDVISEEPPPVRTPVCGWCMGTKKFSGFPACPACCGETAEEMAARLIR